MLLSVIIPVYNGEHFLESTVCSLEDKNADMAEAMEILLINDGSSDNSLIVCAELERRFPNIRVYNKNQGGVGETRNFGLKKATGEYIAFCDQDDRLLQGYSSFIETLSTTNADLLISNYAICRNGILSYTNHIPNDLVLEGNDVKELAKGLLGIPKCPPGSKDKCIPPIYPSIWNCLFRSSFLVQNSITVSSIGQYDDDWILMLDALSVANKTFLSKDVFYQWNDRPNSQSKSTIVSSDFMNTRNLLRAHHISRMRSLALSPKETQDVLISFDKATVLMGYGLFRRLAFRDAIRQILAIDPKPSVFSTIKMIRLPGAVKEKFLLALFPVHLWPVMGFFYSFKPKSQKKN